MYPQTLQDDALSAGWMRWRRWPAPPNWSRHDWRQEASAEAAAAACQAAREYNPTIGIPLGVFVCRRASASVLTHYRREWRYALHNVPAEEPCSRHHGTVRRIYAPAAFEDHPLLDSLVGAIRALSPSDRLMLRALFWEGWGQAELALSLGVSQQAVSKQKHRILRALRDRMAENQSSDGF